MTDTISPSVAVDLPLWRAKRAAQAILPHVSTDDVTPVLTVAQVIGGYLLGTDRYSVGRFTLQDSVPPEQHSDEPDKRYDGRLEEWQTQHEVRYFTGGERTTEPHEMLVPRAALQRISTLSHGLLPTGKLGEQRARVRIEAYEPRVIQEGPRRGEMRGYDWLDVTLYDGERPVLRQTFQGVIGNFPPVARLLDDWKPAEESTPLGLTGWNLAKVTKFAGRNDPMKFIPGNTSAHKLAPLKIEIGTDFVGLIQPNLILR